MWRLRAVQHGHGHQQSEGAVPVPLLEPLRHESLHVEHHAAGQAAEVRVGGRVAVRPVQHLQRDAAVQALQ